MSNRDEKLAAAKRKLKSYQQHQHRQSIPDGSSSTATNGGGGPLSRPLSATLSQCSADESLGGQSSKSAPHNQHTLGQTFAVLEQQSSSLSNFEVVNDDNKNSDFNEADRQIVNSNLNMKNEFSHDELSSPFERIKSKKENNVTISNDIEKLRLREENVELKSICSQLENQLKDLNSHYAQLYTAYQTSVNDSFHENDKDPNVEHLRQEISRHLQTMTVLIQEKSDLQTQLKHTSIVLTQKSDENDRLKVELKNLQSNTIGLDNLKSTNRLLEESFERQTEQLNRSRQEIAQLQAKLTETLQDKSETHARYKQRCKDFDALSKELNSLKENLALKEIYLQQISAQTNQDHEQASFQNQNFLTLQQENQNLSQQITTLQQNLHESRWQNEQEKERYEFFGRQLRTKMDELSSENETLKAENANLKIANEKLSEELHNSLISESRSEEDTEKVESSKVEIEELGKQLASSDGEIRNLKMQLQEKVQLLNESQENLEDKDRRLRQLEEYLDTVTTVDSNAKSLLEQLHNEKAATSRCMGQNLQLKRQLQELEDKFVSIRNEEMELATTVESLEHSLKMSKNEIQEKDAELQKLTLKYHEEIAALKNQVGQNLRQEYGDQRLEDAVRHYQQLYENCAQELTRVQNKAEILEAELECRRKDGEKSVNLVENIEKINDSQETVEKLNRELEETTQRLRRLSSENQELHRIMDQNALDENQNTIHVELNRAVDRCTFLSQENEQLRQSVASLNEQLERLMLNNTIQVPSNGRKSPENRNDDQSSICSEYFDLRRDKETVQNLKSVTEQLQQRLKRALDQNADLHDQNEQLEHLIVKLQSETDTIGEYVTLYQHQRKLIKDKLKEKEDYVAKLSHEHALTQSKLTELQNLMIDLLKGRQVLSAYDVKKVTKRPSPGPPTKLAPRPKRLSETLIDETSPPGSPSIQSPSSDPEESAEVCQEISIVDENLKPSPNNEATVDKILKILTELQKPDLVNQLPPCDRNLHCKYCRGHMIVL